MARLKGEDQIATRVAGSNGASVRAWSSPRGVRGTSGLGSVTPPAFAWLCPCRTRKTLGWVEWTMLIIVKHECPDLTKASARACSARLRLPDLLYELRIALVHRQRLAGGG